MRLFDDQNQNEFVLKDVDGELLLVSQFTLHASTKKGNRPSFIKSAPAVYAEKLYNQSGNYAKTVMRERKLKRESLVL